MKAINAVAIRELAADIEGELARLGQLEQAIQRVQHEIDQDPSRRDLFYENLALKLHNFYTGCEKILQLVAVELNGGLPSGADWHKRLLDRMSERREGRPAVLTPETATRLREFLGFRHIVRNLYGFELDPNRVAALVANYPAVWVNMKTDVSAFIDWLRALAAEMS
ncbi:hypothetical protein [Phormidium sp. FACHB-1136]|jgi:hypothetical protein|uniref:ribonuclease toxin HepT-like protein n=1 Tax=Phormidium sp. FACHB-1136 TaxID=2692848 RepID=UPI001689E8F3|nr:hypothetical protein [Phormidium sp. FACHB-1136]MBD2424838.1 hypothetical protein [Phormidium sp. FACHB-1136]